MCISHRRNQGWGVEGSAIKEFVLQMISSYGYLGLFLSLVLGIVGLPIPDEILMTYCGFLVSRGVLSFGTTLLVAFFGSVAGMSISYILGNKLGQALVEKYSRKVGISASVIHQVQNWYLRYGKFVLVIGYFIPGIRHVTALTAGISKMPFLTFAQFSYLGGFLWSFLFIAFGRLLGENWTKIIRLIHQFSLWITLTLAFCLFLYIYMKWYRKK
jgi:membrane protein DedA with SNARE-associated domain